MPPLTHNTHTHLLDTPWKNHLFLSYAYALLPFTSFLSQLVMQIPRFASFNIHTCAHTHKHTHTHTCIHTDLYVPPQGHRGRAERRWKWIQPCCKWQRKSASVITPRNTQGAFFLSPPRAFCPPSPSLLSSRSPPSLQDSISFLFLSISLNSPLLLLHVYLTLSLSQRLLKWCLVGQLRWVEVGPACVCVCVCSCMHEYIYSFTKHLVQSHLCPHCLCLCLSFHTYVCVDYVCAHVWVCVYVWCHLFVSGSGHIHVFINVPSGQTWLSCLLKQDIVPNNTPSICNSVHSPTTNAPKQTMTFYIYTR